MIVAVIIHALCTANHYRWPLLLYMYVPFSNCIIISERSGSFNKAVCP